VFVRKTISEVSFIWLKVLKVLTPTVKVQLQECYWAMYAVVIRIFVSKFPNPSEIRLIEVLFELREAVLEDSFWVVLVESYEEVDNCLLFLWCECRDGAAFYALSAFLSF
jgi:hypothetical protein